MAGGHGPCHVTAKTLPDAETYSRTTIPVGAMISCTVKASLLMVRRLPCIRSRSACTELTSSPSPPNAGELIISIIAERIAAHRPDFGPPQRHRENGRSFMAGTTYHP